ncbi:MAG: glycine--tRNA ligase [Haloquadratum sp.]|nr:glycine--tRNA ligase [Haloquadratum sp.]
MATGGPAPQVAELARRRGFYFRASAVYEGGAGFYTYGPQGAALKANVEARWRERFADQEGHLQVDAPTIMPEAAFEASGHLDGFDDAMVTCDACGSAHRADHLIEAATDIDDAEDMAPDAQAAAIADAAIDCPTCGASLAGAPVEPFNLMFPTPIGPGSQEPGYLRPETAQAIFVEFPRLKEYARGQLPFGVTQIGRAYRNEISPRRGIVRTREFTQAELELFVDPDAPGPTPGAWGDVTVQLWSAADQRAGRAPQRWAIGDAVSEGVLTDGWIAYHIAAAAEWYAQIGVDPTRLRFRQHRSGERAHYASDCWDAEAEVGDGWIEIAGFAARGQYDLQHHGAAADADFSMYVPLAEPRTEAVVEVAVDMSTLGPRFGADAPAVAAAVEAACEADPSCAADETLTVTVDGEPVEVDTAAVTVTETEQTVAGRQVTPAVIEPSFGIDRTVYTLLVHAFDEDTLDGEPRSVLRLAPAVAPTEVGVFPVVSNAPALVERAEAIAAELRAAGLRVTYDAGGSIGRRYRRQDEVGTPLAVTVDAAATEDDTVTVRARDSGAQVRVPADALVAVLRTMLEAGGAIDAAAEAGHPVEPVS